MSEQEELFEEEIISELNIWLPGKAGDTLIGNVVEVEPNTLYGLAVKIETDKGEILQTPAHKHLQTRVNPLVVGDRVKIVYTGLEIAKSTGRPMNTYTVHRKGIDTGTKDPEKAK